MIYFSSIRLKTLDNNYTNDLAEQIQNLQDGQRYLEQYGTDLAMMGTGELMPETNVSGTDLLIVGGLLNYTQAILHRLMTVRGTLPEDQTIGISWYNYLGQNYYDKDFILTQLKDEIANEVYRDYRTQDVASIEARFSDNTVIEFEMVLVPIDGQSTALSFNVNRSD